MRQVNTPAASQALERQFALRGHVGIQLDEVAVPVALMGDFAGKGPFETRVLGGDAVTSPAGGVGTYAGVLVTPGAGTICVVEAMYVRNNSGGTQIAVVKLMRPADVAAVNVTSANQAIGRWNGQILSTGFISQTAATYSLYDHTALNVGGDIGELVVLNANMGDVRLPRGVVLDGTDPAGPISLSLLNRTANQAILVGFAFTEYHVPG